MKNWSHELEKQKQLSEAVLKQATQLGATNAQVNYISRQVLFTSVRQQEVETLGHYENQVTAVTLYIDKQKGEATTTDNSSESLQNMVNAAYRIAKTTQPDQANGLADHKDLAHAIPDLKLYHPWQLESADAIEKTKACEARAMEMDSRISSEGVSIDTAESMVLHANTNGFMESYLSSRHGMYCNLIARDLKGLMQQDSSYTIHCNPNQLASIESLASKAVERTVRRLGARRIKTMRVPVIFEAQVAGSLISAFLSAISGAALYNKQSFLLNAAGKSVFSSHMRIEERPYELSGLGSVPFDSEGVAPKTRYLIEDGILQSYLLSSYSARRLSLKTTGNASGYYNIKLQVHEPDLYALLTKMDKGLLVTEVIGHGVNLTTGDYSQGITGFWVENGAIQYPVEELTVAGNLKDMYQKIVAVSGDINRASRIQTGSILVEQMTVAGE